MLAQFIMHSFLVLLCVSVSSSVKWGHPSPCLVGLWGGVTEMRVKCSDPHLLGPPDHLRVRIYVSHPIDNEAFIPKLLTNWKNRVEPAGFPISAARSSPTPRHMSEAICPGVPRLASLPGRTRVERGLCWPS